jgi:hypothetical protein
MITNGVMRPRKPMIEFSPAATAPCSSVEACSAISNGHAALTAAMEVPSTIVATRTVG